MIMIDTHDISPFFQDTAITNENFSNLEAQSSFLQESQNTLNGEQIQNSIAHETNEGMESKATESNIIESKATESNTTQPYLPLSGLKQIVSIEVQTKKLVRQQIKGQRLFSCSSDIKNTQVYSAMQVESRSVSMTEQLSQPQLVSNRRQTTGSLFSVSKIRTAIKNTSFFGNSFRSTGSNQNRNVEESLQAYKKSDSLTELQIDLSGEDLTSLQQIDGFRQTVANEALRLLDPVYKKQVFITLARDFSHSRLIYQKLEFPEFRKSNILKKTKEVKDKNKIKTQLQALLNSLSFPIPSLVGFVDSQFNLEKIVKIYRNPYLLNILKDLSKSPNYNSLQQAAIKVMIENYEFVQLGVQIDHFLTTAVRSALFGHIHQSNNTRNNEDCDSNWSTLIPLKKNKQQIIHNLNSLRTSGRAADTLSSFNTQNTFRQDMAEFCDNEILGNDFRIGLHNTYLTKDQKNQFLTKFVIGFEYVIDHAIRASRLKYGELIVNTEPALLVFLDYNVRLQRINQALKKVRNLDYENLLTGIDMCKGIENVAQHKNLILAFVDTLYNENLNPDPNLQQAQDLEKENLKNTIKSDFLNLLTYNGEDLINLDNSEFVSNNIISETFSDEVKKMDGTIFLKPEHQELEIKKKKRDFINTLKSTDCYFPELILPTFSSEFFILFSLIRDHNELYIHYDTNSLYISPFKILQTQKSLEKAETDAP